ncbi:hypothetical protein WOLCODRAFT_140719 [Wolfiporia cocos MD-104 SS10]|uniref:Uncharacterized protein n=1 Tax=Wolfiporia cocos (strain MD-104) TaxID=742152 RepID=A0A2H3JEG2_WOLCO|nr:hypothetical protein WOLCODRAFT_140719 [Wolfiporia cocos MD-104 SS10]
MSTIRLRKASTLHTGLSCPGIYRQTTHIDRLPVEIISYIFTIGHYVDSDDRKRGRSPPTAAHRRISPCESYAHNFPWIISHVSKRWRELAFSTAELWSKILVTDYDAPPWPELDDDHSYFYTVRLMVARSQGFPLDIYIEARDPAWDMSEFDISTAGNTPGAYGEDAYEYKHPFQVWYMQVLFDILLPHLSRCRSLAILTDRWQPMYSALRFLCGDGSQHSAPRAPLLEHLVLMRCNDSVCYSPTFDQPDFNDLTFLPFNHSPGEVALPRLQKLILSGVHTDWPLLPAMIPSASRIRTLELSYHCKEVRPNTKVFRNLIKQCPVLENLIVKISMPIHPPGFFDRPNAYDSTLDGSPVPIKTLQNLSIAYDDLGDAIRLLHMFDMPRVRCLRLTQAEFIDEPATDASLLLTSFSRPSFTGDDSQLKTDKPLFPQLLSAKLESVSGTTEAFRAFFETMPKLRHINISGSADNALNALRPSAPHDPVQSCPCPLLDDLRVDFDQKMDLMHEVLAERRDYERRR